jgi:hypothetical protein
MQEMFEALQTDRGAAFCISMCKLQIARTLGGLE